MALVKQESTKVEGMWAVLKGRGICTTLGVVQENICRMRWDIADASLALLILQEDTVNCNIDAERGMKLVPR